MPASGLSITCPRCHKRLRIHGGKPGSKVRCLTSGCGNVLVLPTPLPQQAEVFDLDDEPAPPRPVPRRRPVTDEPDEEPERADKSPMLLIGMIAAGVLLLGGLGGLVYWLRSDRSPRDTANPAAGTNPVGVGSGNLAVGPRVKLLEKLPDSIKVRDYYMAGEFRRGGEDRFGKPDKDWPQTLPAGTVSVNVGVAFEFEPPQGTDIAVEIEGDSGPIQLGGGGVLTIRGPEGTTVEFQCRPLTGGYADGRYKAKVKIDGKAVAELNFAVGERLAGVSASTAKGTKWVQPGGSGYHFNFAADGTLTVEASWDMGRKTTGKWVADGETVTGHVHAADGSGQRTEYRGQCLKDEIWMRSRIGKDNSWYALGVLIKDDGTAPKRNDKKDEFPETTKEDFVRPKEKD